MYRNLLVAFVFLYFGEAHSATLNIDGSDNLIGAFDVDVSGNLYNVDFLDGTCADVFGTCAETNFAFTTATLADAASQALLEQVFIQDTTPENFKRFDDDPELTRGIEATNEGRFYSAWGRQGSNVRIDAAINSALLTGDTNICMLGGCLVNINEDLDSPVLTWARWSAVNVIPVPAAIWLFGSALAGFVGLSRRRYPN